MPEFNIPTPESNTWVPLVMRAPDVAPEQVLGQLAAPLVPAVPAEGAPVEEALGERAPVGRGPQEREPGSREPERAAPVVPVRSTAAVALAVSVSVGLLAVRMPAPEERDWPG